ncbi:uncharacterized protein LOC105839792 [Monomorium pharaonis]|uniref:uncharacterized protein LOC105839792 n=1 Tax=Monomorium pharaonis TaxID=307658 RepID=UPI001745EEE3|nr:uncharacterized protein LOC105839792 [Monomorium pharaonis]
MILPMNESRSEQLIITVEYFIDRETYFFAIIHIIVAQYAGCITITSVATILIAYVMHTCAMFQIASHRIKHIFDENLELISKDIKQYTLYNKLIHAVYVHRRAIDLTNILTNSFATLYFVLLGFGVASMSLSFFNVSVYAITAIKEIIYLKKTLISDIRINAICKHYMKDMIHN